METKKYTRCSRAARNERLLHSIDKPKTPPPLASPPPPPERVKDVTPSVIPKGIRKMKGEHGYLLYKWFLSLTPEERGRVLSFEDKDGIAVIKEMFNEQEVQGDGLFFAVDDMVLVKVQERTRGIVKFESNFCFKKLSSLFNLCLYPERFLHSDKKLEESTRLCDTREYLDTMTVASDLLESGKQFLDLMEVVTRGNFLKNPCKVAWDGHTKTWIWESPSWFTDMGYYSLGTFIAMKLEKVLWMRYYDFNKLDPRSKPSSLSYSFPSCLEGLLSKSYLIEFWKQCSPRERRKIVGSLGDIIQHVLLETDDQDRKKKLRQADYQKLLSGLVELSVEERSIELLFSDTDLAQNEKTFIEILYFSPLQRAGMAFDMILRRIGMSIHSAYTEKLSIDLIVGEEAEKIKNASQDEKKQRRRKKKKMKKKKNQTEKEQKEKELREKEKMEKERKEKERIERERLLQEAKRKHSEITKLARCLVSDLIAQVEDIIEHSQKLELPLPSSDASPSSSCPSSISPARKKKNRKKKKKNQIEHSRKDILSLSPPSERHAKRDRSSSGGLRKERAHSQDPSTRRRAPEVEPLGPKPSFALLNRLDQEIHEHVQSLKLEMEKYYRPGAESMIMRICKAVKILWPSASVERYGSYATGLSIPSSDLDLVIIGVPRSPSSSPLQQLSSLLRSLGWIHSLNAIETAKVPVLKVRSNYEQIPTDITFEEDDLSTPTFCSQGGLLVRHSGLATCETVKSYLHQFPSSYPLVLVIKQFLSERGLNDAYTGGLKSYCVVLMVVSLLQLYARRDDSDGPQLGLLLSDFLYLYGKKFDYRTTGISVTDGNHFDLKMSHFKFAAAPLVIVDPLNPTNNIGHHTFGIERIKGAFAEAHTRITNPFHLGFTPANVLGRIIALQDDMGSRRCNDNEMERSRTRSSSTPSMTSWLRNVQ